MSPLRAGSLALALGVASLLAAQACMVETGSGGFGDAGTQAESGEPPDLPKPECDPRRETDCEEGFKCSYVEEGAFGATNRCVELLGGGLAGESCEVIGDSDTCANHHVCWGLDEQGAGGRCMSFCSVALQCPESEDVCTVSNYDLLFLCMQKCDPIAQDCEEEGWGCYPDANKRWSCDRDRSGLEGAHAEPCECLNCCDPGLICVPGTQVDGGACGSIMDEEGVEPAEGCCAAVCDRSDELTPIEELCPTPDERCRAYYDSDAVLMGYEDVGVCRL